MTWYVNRIVPDLEMQLNDAKREIELLTQEFTRKKNEVDLWRENYQELKKTKVENVRLNATPEQLPPENLNDAITSVQNEFPERLVILRNKIDSDAHQFNSAESVYKVLIWLATTYWDARTKTTACPNLDHSCREFSGFFYSSKQSDVTMGKFKKDYFINWNKRKRRLEEHVGLGRGRDPRHSIRIAFFYDEEKKVIVVGYIGQHQQTSAS